MPFYNESPVSPQTLSGLKWKAEVQCFRDDWEVTIITGTRSVVNYFQLTLLFTKLLDARNSVAVPNEYSDRSELFKSTTSFSETVLYTYWSIVESTSIQHAIEWQLKTWQLWKTQMAASIGKRGRLEIHLDDIQMLHLTYCCI